MWDTKIFPRTDNEICAPFEEKKYQKRCSARVAFLMWITSVYMCAIATARDFTIKHAMHAQIS